MDISTVLVIFAILAISLVACGSVFAHYLIQVKKLSELLKQTSDLHDTQRATYDKIHALFNRRLNSHKTLLLTLHSALEGAAKGSTEAETLKKLEVFADFAKPTQPRKP